MLFIRYSRFSQEEDLKRLICATILLVLISVVQNKVFASRLDCKFKTGPHDEIGDIQLIDEDLIINSSLEIPLEKTTVKCGNFGRQVRFDGNALGYQVILKSCTTEAELEGLIIDSINLKAIEVNCYSRP
jgi:hypothetical protein